MADRGPWYTYLNWGDDVDLGVNVYNDLDDNLVAYLRPYGYSSWAVYERPRDGSVWAFTLLRERDRAIAYLTGKYRQKAS